MRRSTVLSFPLQLVFPDLTIFNPLLLRCCAMNIFSLLILLPDTHFNELLHGSKVIERSWVRSLARTKKEAGCKGTWKKCLFLMYFLLNNFLWQWQTLKLPKAQNEGKWAANFCCQVATWFPDMFCNLYLVKNHKTTTKARKKIAWIWNPYNSRKSLMHVWLNFKTIKFYLVDIATDFYWQTSYVPGERDSLISPLKSFTTQIPVSLTNLPQVLNTVKHLLGHG